MRKKDELAKATTCMAHAHDEEMVFVLLSRDAAAPVAIRAWVAERVKLGKNVESDPQIVEALECASTMEREGAKWRDELNRKADWRRCQCGPLRKPITEKGGDTFFDRTGCLKCGLWDEPVRCR